MPMLTRTALAALVLGLMVLVDMAPAGAQVRSREIVPIGRDGHMPEGRGCYWANGRGTCRAYCYIEVDGRRFCTERSRMAFPQAPVMDRPDDFVGPLK